MGEHLLRITLAELGLVRVVCVNCNAAVEVPLSALHNLDSATCQICGLTYRLPTITPRGGVSQFTALQNAIEAAVAMKERCHIEFPVKLPSAEQ